MLLTLLPDSSTLVLSWPWVLLWQVAFASAIAWCLLLLAKGKLQRLGYGLDAIAALFGLSLILSTIFSPFPRHAVWNSVTAVGFLAALYALKSQLATAEMRERLLTWQGYLSVAFIVESLLLWANQTYFPEIQKLQQFQRLGVDLGYDFSILELRNWAPIGHQNYVAGYLLLALPLLASLAALQQGWRRWLWVSGTVLGVVDLYTTSSRGGWLGLAVFLCFVGGIVGWRSKLPRWKLGTICGGAIAVFALVIVTNNRFISLISGLLKGEGGGELSYRIITAVTGWEMGASQWLTGTGLGSVPLLYQKFRPFWAGREAELAYQLHSTPVQIWAELGLLGTIAALGTIAIFAYICSQKLPEDTAKSDRLFRYSLSGALVSYLVFSLTDFQLDLVPITGILIIYIAILSSLFSPPPPLSPSPTHKYIALALTGVAIAVLFWLVPTHRSWQLSSNAFLALSPPNPQVDRFVNQLDRAAEIAPWESYYRYQLGWQLAELGNREQAIANFQAANAVSPYREFGSSNLGWLLLANDPELATSNLARSTQLVPAKRGVFYLLGLGFLAQDKEANTIEALTLEVLRDPQFATSPLWQESPLLERRDRVFAQVDRAYTAWIQESPDENFTRYLHQVRGALRWWRGNFNAAKEDWEKWGTPLQQTILELSVNAEEGEDFASLQPSERNAIAAWQQPDDRLRLLQQAWIAAERQPLGDNIVQTWLVPMANAESFYEWLTQYPPTLTYRRTRAGFGVLSRHTDGFAPRDFPVWVENAAIAYFFPDLFPSPEYLPALDFRLQPRRDRLLDRK